MTTRLTDEQADGYLKYAGKCKEYVDALILERPELTAVRGYYWEPAYGEARAHWWAVTPDGEIVDPTAAQFPSNGKGFYQLFSGIVTCANCGKEMDEEEANFHGNYAFCSTPCLCRFVGV